MRALSCTQALDLLWPPLGCSSCPVSLALAVCELFAFQTIPFFELDSQWEPLARPLLLLLGHSNANATPNQSAVAHLLRLCCSSCPHGHSATDAPSWQGGAGMLGSPAPPHQSQEVATWGSSSKRYMMPASNKSRVLSHFDGDICSRIRLYG